MKVNTSGAQAPHRRASLLDHALAHAARGLRVFPLTPGGKTPAIKDWQRQATTNRKAIKKWWRECSDYNIGIRTGDGLVVVKHNTKPGPETFRVIGEGGFIVAPGSTVDGFTYKIRDPHAPIAPLPERPEWLATAAHSANVIRPIWKTTGAKR